MTITTPVKPRKTILSLLAFGLALGTLHIPSAQAGELPTRDEMWKIIQQQQRAIDILKGRQADAREDIQDAQQGLRSVQANVEKSAGLGGLPEGVSISSVVEVEANHNSDYAGTDTSDITLATAELGIEAQVNEWVSANMIFLYEDPGPVDIDEDSITIGNTEQFPLYLTAGKIKIPFGGLETQLVTDPLTLTIGEAGEVAIVVGFEASGFSGSVYAFNGDIDKTGSDNAIAHGGVKLGYGMESDNMSFNIGAGYLNNIADVDGITPGTATIQNLIGGYTIHSMLGMGGFTLIGEYITADKSFQAAELAWKTGGAKPSAWQTELGYTFELTGRETTIAANYQGTDEALAVGLPEARVAVGASMALFENTTLAVEWMHDEDYGVADGGTGNDANTATMKLAVEF